MSIVSRYLLWVIPLLLLVGCGPSHIETAQGKVGLFNTDTKDTLEELQQEKALLDQLHANAQAYKDWEAKRKRTLENIERRRKELSDYILKQKGK